MKKILSSLFILILLVGCTQTEDKVIEQKPIKEEKKQVVKEKFDTNRCKIETDTTDYTMDIEIKSKEDEIKELIITATIPDFYSYMGIDVETLKDEDKNILKQELLKDFLVNKNAKGITYKPVFDENKFIVSLTMNMDQADKELKDLIKNDDDALSLTSLLERFTNSGYTCK